MVPADGQAGSVAGREHIPNCARHPGKRTPCDIERTRCASPVPGGVASHLGAVATLALGRAGRGRRALARQLPKVDTMTHPHLIIVGGGLAGLSAGCYALRSGFRVTIVEHNLALGGVCTAWR
jgi:NADPH-dependent 2,4-dienoyl-CoA reductase/sulfur reductase-like enzyme